MNFVFLSPHFPPNYYQFAVALKNQGLTVLGLADERYDALRPQLKSALTEYYRVGDMHDYNELVRALGYFTHHYGKLDRIDSQSEYWLETEARLRTDFNITGIRTNQIEGIKRKSRMRETFVKAGIKVARGRVVKDLKDALRLIGETGYPVVAKPDVGVGAASTYKVHNENELKAFFDTKPPIDYLMEEFIKGQICTFDGLTDREGKPVFVNSLEYSAGVMETVLDDALIYYYTLREIPADLEELGRRVLEAFDVHERFFHFEFFREADTGDLLALEVNMRPPGGLTTDMFNYACDIDIYNAWASIIAGKGFPYPDYSHKYYCCYVGRKFNREYPHSDEEIFQAYGNRICHHEPISGVFSRALGDYGYIVRSPELQDVVEVAEFIQEQ
ncbi:MAG TPA: ATP-grasp domain-containing protein [Anaerolineales bacterium]|nr:ATP-grasp domain-containing protein [Anaerolineales bacterium]